MKAGAASSPCQKEIAMRLMGYWTCGMELDVTFKDDELKDVNGLIAALHKEHADCAPCDKSTARKARQKSDEAETPTLFERKFAPTGTD